MIEDREQLGSGIESGFDGTQHRLFGFGVYKSQMVLLDEEIMIMILIDQRYWLPFCCNVLPICVVTCIVGKKNIG